MLLDRDFTSSNGTDSEDESLLPNYGTKQNVEDRSTVKRIVRHKVLVISLALNLVLSLFAFILLLIQTKYMHSPDNVASYRIFNHVPLSARTFEHDHSFDGDPHDDKGPWEGLIPAGRGFVRVSDPIKYDLAPGVPLGDEFPGQQGYLVSMYHQLHCIAVLKKTIIEAQDPENRPAHFSKLNVTLLGNIELEHSQHCVEYLRQAVLCAGDLTLEPAEFVDGKISHAVSGWGVEHVCRDSNYIFDMVSERAVNNASGVTA